MRQVKACSVPLPPLAEQKRIVAKVDELMALCDQLEAQQQERARQHAALSRAALARFTADPTPENLTALFQPTWPTTPTDLRKTILTLAVTGRLSRQQQQLPDNKCREDWPFNIPITWSWNKLGDIAQIERGGSPRPIKEYITEDPEGLNWIKIGDTEKGGKYITSTREKIKKEGLKKTRQVFPGDFLLTNSMSFGRPYITQIEGCIHDGWLRIHPPKSLNPDFLYHLLSSSFVFDFLSNAAAGAVVQNLNADKVRDLPIPVPPLEEQIRLVTQAERLLDLVDNLERQQAEAQATGERLLAALVAECTGTSASATSFAPSRLRVRQNDPANQSPTSPKAKPTTKPTTKPSRESKEVSREGAKTRRGRPAKLPSREEQATLLTLLRERGTLTNADAQAATGLDAATIRTHLKALVTAGHARTEGQRRGMRYIAT